MREVIPVIPAVEVRETFTPSEPLRDVFMELCDPVMDATEKESLRAAFLVRSLHRRVIESDEYNYNEYQRAGSIYIATKLFESLSMAPVPLNGQLGVNLGSVQSLKGRIIFQTKLTDGVIRARQILSQIPTVAEHDHVPAASNLFFVEVAKHSLLARREDQELTLRTLRSKIENAKHTAMYTIKPRTITTRSTIIRPALLETDQAS